MTYNYADEMKKDVQNYINDEIVLEDFESREELEDHLNEELWNRDSITGNASGSYTFNRWQAEEYLAHNWELLAEAFEVFGCDAAEAFNKGAEFCDVTIRCYLLPQVISEVLDELETRYTFGGEPDGQEQTA